MGHKKKKNFIKKKKKKTYIYHSNRLNYGGHGELLELRLLEKSARHDFIIARHHLSNNIFSCHLLESS
jgi:hypothetical protein